MHSDQATVRPVAHVKRLLVLHREFRAGAETHAGRATDANRDGRGQAVGVIFRPFAAAFAESLVAAAHRMERANRAVPRIAPVPFHVAVEAKQFTVGIECNVVGVAFAGGEQFRVLAVEIHARDEAARRLLAGAKTVAVFRALEHQIVCIISVRRRRRQVVGDAGEISADHVKHSVRSEHDAVRAVLARAALPFAQEFNVIEAVIAFGVFAAEQAEDLAAFVAFAVRIDVQHVVDKQHAHRFADGNVQDFFLDDLAVVQRQARDGLPALGA